MKVLLLTSPPPPSDMTPFSTREKLMPLGVGFLISILKNHGHQVDFQDLYLENQILANIEKYDLVGTYCNTICFRGTLRIINECCAAKKRGWKGKLAIGGPHTSVALNTIPDEVDYVVQGEGEGAILDIAEERVHERLIKKERIVDLDSLPRPSYDVFSRLPYDTETDLVDANKVYPMNTSRGCPFSCTFCSVKSIWGRQYAMFSEDRVLDDIKALVRDFGVDGFYFREDNFMVNKQRVRRLCERILSENLKIKWAVEARVDAIDQEILSLMSRAGCTGLYLGVEAGTQKLLNDYRKGITVEQIENALRIARNLGIRTYASFIIDTPQETLEDRLSLLKLIERTRPSTYCLNSYVGLPWSELYEQVIQRHQYLFIDDIGLAFMPKKAFPTWSFGLIIHRVARNLLHPFSSIINVYKKLLRGTKHRENIFPGRKR